MFFRLIADNFTRRPRRKFLTAAALSLGMAVATAALSVSLDVGDRLSEEFKSLGANLVVTPEADSLPLEIGGVDFRPANSGAYLPESDLPKIKSVFWHNNITRLRAGFGDSVTIDEPDPIRRSCPPWSQVPVALANLAAKIRFSDLEPAHDSLPMARIRHRHSARTNPWWHVAGSLVYR